MRACRQRVCVYVYTVMNGGVRDLLVGLGTRSAPVCMPGGVTATACDSTRSPCWFGMASMESTAKDQSMCSVLGAYHCSMCALCNGASVYASAVCI
jgi:hypothetical protein